MVQHQDLTIDLLYQLDFLPVLTPLCSRMLRWLRLSTDPSQVTCLTTIVTLCCSKRTLGGLVGWFPTPVAITVRGLALSLEETLPMFLECGIGTAAGPRLCSLRAFSAAVSIICVCNLYGSLKRQVLLRQQPFFFESFRSVTHTQNDLWVRHPNTHWTHNVLSTAWVLQRTPPPTRPLLDYDVNPLRSGGAVEVIKACTLWQWN